VRFSDTDFKNYQTLHKRILSRNLGASSYLRLDLYMTTQFKAMKNHLMMYLFQHTNSSKQKLRYKL